MLTTPQRSAHLVVQSQFLNTMVGTQFFAPMAETQLSACIFQSQILDFDCLPQLQTTQLSAYMDKSQLPTDSFWKSSNSQDHRFRAWRHSHSTHISYLGFIMTIVIVISFARKRKLYPTLCTWTKSRIVQSQTKLNDKI